MPHLIVHRDRGRALKNNRSGERSSFSRETVNAIIYTIGGLVFVVGSVFFLPVYDKLEAVGAWTFFGGSLLYAIVTTYDLFESYANFKRQEGFMSDSLTELLAAIVYVIGTFLFVVGSLFFLPQLGTVSVGAWCFIIGSALFLVGAFINDLQIVREGTLLALQLFNATAVSFIMGSVLFFVASVPYLWRNADSPSRERLFTYVAWEFIVGSALFFIGGVFNCYRVYLNESQEREAARAENEGDCLE